MLALCIVASAFLPLPSSSPALPAVRRAPTASVQLSLAEERVESFKAGAITAVIGSMASAPVKASALLASSKASSTMFTAQWEFCTYALFVQLFLFGVCYRCIMRDDDNDMLRQGAVGAAALCRALSLTQVKEMWSPDMWLTIFTYFGESMLVFGVASAALEFAWNRGYAFRLPGIGLPPMYGPMYDRDPFGQPMGYRDDFRGGPGGPGGYRDNRFLPASYRDDFDRRY